MKIGMSMIAVIMLNFFSLGASKNIYIVPFGGFEGEKLFAQGYRDDCMRAFRMMKQAANNAGYQIKTTTTLKDMEDFEVVVVFDVPLDRPGVMQALQKLPKEKCILFAYEPPTVKPYNYNKTYHELFSRVYTLLDDWHDGKKYFKLYETQPTLEPLAEFVPFNQKKLCTMMIGHKTSPHPQELYSARKRWIEFCERECPADFDFYGPGWNGNQYKCYRGVAVSKMDTLKNYKFAIAYENMQGNNGYITDKPLFCLVAGCVPIYWGAPNVLRYMPSNCFIDRTKFNSDKELYEFLVNMPEAEYNQYLLNMRAYLKTAQAWQFSCEHFADMFLRATGVAYDENQVFTPEQVSMLKWLEHAGFRANV